jgi:hypothetical protein
MSDTEVGTIRVYQDNLSRLIVAELLEETVDMWVVKNPLILNVQTTQGQISIQFFPIMFKEFQADKDEPTIWEVNRKNITPCKNITLDARLVSQYKNIFAPAKGLPPMMNTTPSMQTGLAGTQQAPTAPAPSVIKLFDD